MMTADLAFALLINRTSAFYQTNPPVYMTYTEHTHVTAPTLGRSARHRPVHCGASRR